MSMRLVMKGVVLLMVSGFFGNAVAYGKPPYEVLGVQPTATADEIGMAFRRLAKQYHPDRTNQIADKNNLSGPKREAFLTAKTKQFKEVQEAFEILSDPNKRASYDRSGETTPESVIQPRQPVAKASERVMRALQSHRGKPMDEMVAEAYALLSQEKAGYMTLTDIWERVGSWVEFSGGFDDVTEAAFKGAFAYLDRLRGSDPNKVERVYEQGVRYIKNSHLYAASRSKDATSIQGVMERVLSFAENTRLNGWHPPSSGTCAKAVQSLVLKNSKN